MKYAINRKAINTPLDLLEVLSMLGIVKNTVFEITDEDYFKMVQNNSALFLMRLPEELVQPEKQE
jgi:hypothetical protein